MSNDSTSKPLLIFRDDDAINREISTARQHRATMAAHLKNLQAALSRFLSDRETYLPNADLVFECIYMDDPKTWLLNKYKIRRELPADIRPEAIQTLFNVPDLSVILDLIQKIKTLESNSRLPTHAYTDKEGNCFESPNVTKEEKESIVEKHSIYLTTERGKNLFKAIDLLAAGLNIINFELSPTQSRNSVGQVDVQSILPLEYRKFIEFEKTEGTKFRLVPAFKKFAGM